MTITAKYSGVCAACGREIEVGSKIEWQRGKKARHAVCPTVEPVNAPNVKFSNPAEAAAHYGRVARAGAEIMNFGVAGLPKGDNGPENGTIHIVRGVRYVQVSRQPRRYFSAAMLEDFDMFDSQPGGYVQWDGVAVEPTPEEAAKDAEAAKRSEAGRAKAAKELVGMASVRVVDPE